MTERIQKVFDLWTVRSKVGMLRNLSLGLLRVVFLEEV